MTLARRAKTRTIKRVDFNCSRVGTLELAKWDKSPTNL
jgi:hypothetical protein